jgi:GNAT superfamily N-acetyltransferase
MPELAALTRIAHADAWEAQGRLREPWGGAALALRGIRVMASGMPQPHFNSADVVAADCDLAGARAFYAARGVGWGVRVPSGMAWTHGRHVLTIRLMALPAREFAPAPGVPGLVLRPAGPADLETAVALDAEAFGESAGPAWFTPLLASTRVAVALALLGGEPVGTAYTLRSDGLAGPCVYLAGVGVAAAARRRGIGAAISAWLLERAFAAGAGLAHLHADTDEAARVYARLRFIETPGLEAFVDL